VADLGLSLDLKSAEQKEKAVMQNLASPPSPKSLKPGHISLKYAK